MLLTRSLREASSFDRAAVSVSGGLLTAIPVVAVFAGGIAGSDPVAAVTMGAGAMLAGIARRIAGGPRPVALVSTTALVMASSTFLGAATGSLPWLHLVILCAASLGAGLLVAVGLRGAIVGTQAIIALVVFGRFSQSPGDALGLAGLVLAGGAAQALFAALVRWPPPLHVQRSAVAAAYRALSQLARADPGESALPAARTLDDAATTLAAPMLLGDPAVMRLRGLVDEGYRMRVSLSAIRALRAQLEHVQLDQLLALASATLAGAAAAISGDQAAARTLAARADEFTREASRPLDPQLGHVVAALAGTLRAASSLAAAASEPGRLLGRRPQPGVGRVGESVRNDLAQLRANLALSSPAARHALRLAVLVPGTELLASHLPLHRSYWMVVAAATVLRPEFGATFTRGAERVLGTCAGVALAGLITVTVHPTHVLTIVIIGLLAWAAYALFSASFTLGFAFITAMIVFLLDAIYPDTLATAGDRLLDTLAGGAIGLLAYALWPTWSAAPARRSLAELVGAQRAYLGAILSSLLTGRHAVEGELMALARRARRARTAAEAAVAQSLGDPLAHQIDEQHSASILTELRRLVEAAHVLRIDTLAAPPPEPLSALAPLAADLDRQFEQIEDSLRGMATRSAPLPQLREDYGALERSGEADRASPALLAELDEIIDAANSLAGLLRR